MKISRLKINFKGGIISPGELLILLETAEALGARQAGFGLRQQLYLELATGVVTEFKSRLSDLKLVIEENADAYPNIVSSYPAEEVFIQQSWLSEGVYKDILDELDHRPRLKINISNSNQSFTPLFTGNINWVAAPGTAHFWWLFIRLPRSNDVYQWDQMVYTNDVARLSRELESRYFAQPHPAGSDEAAAAALMATMDQEGYNLKPVSGTMQLPPFNLPYYEGFNRHNSRYWLGVYRRSEMFPLAFLKELSQLCLQTKIGEICSTPWKSIILKGIEGRDKPRWSDLLDRYEINMRHAANELNFQVQDNDPAARRLKQRIVRRFNDWDLRSFGICLGIKTQPKTEIFSSILIRRKPLLRLFGKPVFWLYDILCARDFNPNERTENIFISNITRPYLAAELANAVRWFYKKRMEQQRQASPPETAKPRVEPITLIPVHQCPDCLTVYDPQYGDPDRQVAAGTPFTALPAAYACPVCGTAASGFLPLDAKTLLPVTA
ncbi:hypothetical protein GCM10027051_06120 [Niabella terrae]